jgi:hypothetical protein
MTATNKGKFGDSEPLAQNDEQNTKQMQVLRLARIRSLRMTATNKGKYRDSEPVAQNDAQKAEPNHDHEAVTKGQSICAGNRMAR